MQDDALPPVDEHEEVVAATPERTWAALARVLPRAFAGRGARAYARAIGLEPPAARGDFLAEGSALAGFRVARADAPHELVLDGRHRFARYRLVFALEAVDAGRATRVRARTHSAFPGAAGRAYRAAVIGTGAHALLVRRMLRAVAHEAERVRA